MSSNDFLDEKALLERLRRRPGTQGMLAMYSTWWGGWVKEPGWMLAPVDDHQFHRGDGVFEALKTVDGKVYLMGPHLDRLERSAAALGISFPLARRELELLLQEASAKAGSADTVLRLFLARGPGQFTVNPYDSPASQIYLIVTAMKAPPQETFEKGVRIGFSAVPVKEPFFAQAKTCNYLPNVLMKKEAVDRGLDFVVGVDPRGALAESATENLLWVNSRGELARPLSDRILAGTTMQRLFELARPLVREGLLRGFSEEDLPREELFRCPEAMIAGTTLDVLPVVECEGRPIGSGKPGPVAKRLLELLRADQRA